MVYRQDYYTVLGIEETATLAEVRSAYRRAARAHHPDLNPGDIAAADRFKRIQEAYDVLGDPARRATYRRPPSGGANGHSPRPRPTPSADPSLGAEFAEALLVLRLLAREAQLERRLRRLFRYLEGL